jgi:hypothetical protein
MPIATSARPTTVFVCTAGAASAPLVADAVGGADDALGATDGDGDAVGDGVADGVGDGVGEGVAVGVARGVGVGGDVRTGVGVGVGGGVAITTEIVPTITGWIAQWYAYVPSRSNVRRYVSPGWRRGLDHDPSFATTWCGVAPRFVHDTVSPGRIVRVNGSKAKSRMITVDVSAEETDGRTIALNASAIAAESTAIRPTSRRTAPSV